MKIYLYTDGGVRTGGLKGPTQGRTGMGAIGYVIRDAENAVLDKGGLVLDYDATVNECEYSAVIFGLNNAFHLGATDVVLRSDSQLVVYQMKGEWQCRNASLREYLTEALREADRFDRFEIEWIPREQNQMADAITRTLLPKKVKVA